ncbi:MAG TPA: SRPBCC family protein [Kofleriaceae bacterium]|nr:SRPBCC family protein [Kofleriaceae bacterium]
MATDVLVELEIPRPRAAVAAYMFDPAHDARWTSGVIAVNPLTPGRLRTGSRVERTVKFLGKRFAYTYEVLDARDDAFVEMTVTQPFPMQIRYQLDDAGASATRVGIHARGDASGFYRLMSPIMNRMVRRSIRRDLDNLARCLAT